MWVCHQLAQKTSLFLTLKSATALNQLKNCKNLFIDLFMQHYNAFLNHDWLFCTKLDKITVDIERKSSDLINIFHITRDSIHKCNKNRTSNLEGLMLSVPRKFIGVNAFSPYQPLMRVKLGWSIFLWCFLFVEVLWLISLLDYARYDNFFWTTASFTGKKYLNASYSTIVNYTKY